MPEELIPHVVIPAKAGTHGYGTQVKRTTLATPHPWGAAFTGMTSGMGNRWQNTPQRLTPTPGFAKGAAFERA
jgi:hypothetical protein